MRERNNGLYSSAAYALANTLTSLPFLFACNLVFLLIACVLCCQLGVLLI